MTLNQIKKTIGKKNFRMIFCITLANVANYKNKGREWVVFPCDTPVGGNIGIVLSKTYPTKEKKKDIVKLFQEKLTKKKCKLIQDSLDNEDFEISNQSIGFNNTDDFNGLGLKPEHRFNIVKRVKKYLKIK